MGTPPPPDRELVKFVVVAVTIVWALAFIMGFYSHDYEPLIYASPPMGLVVGYVTGVRILRKMNGAG